MRYVVVSNFPDDFLEMELPVLKTEQEGLDALIDVVSQASGNNEDLTDISVDLSINLHLPDNEESDIPIHLLHQNNDEKPIAEYFVGNRVYGLYQRPTKR